MMESSGKERDPGAARSLRLKPVKTLDHDRELLAARFSPCGGFIFAGGYDGLVHRWDLQDWKREPLSGHRGWLQGIVFHPDGGRMFTADSWGRITCWSLAGEVPAVAWTVEEAHPGWLQALSISPDGRFLATCGGNREVRLWSAGDGSPRARLAGHEGPVFCVRFHPRGDDLVSGDLHGLVIHWDLRTGQEARRLDARVLYLRPDLSDVGGVRSLAFDSWGTTLACAGSQPLTSGFVTGKPTVVLIDWNAGASRQTLQLPGATPEDGFALEAAWHPEGFVMAATSGSPGRGSLWCWEPGEAAPFHVSRDLMHCRSFSLHPRGDLLAVARVSQGGGHGRVVDAAGEYLGQTGHVHFFELELGGARIRAF